MRRCPLRKDISVLKEWRLSFDQQLHFCRNTWLVLVCLLITANLQQNVLKDCMHLSLLMPVEAPGTLALAVACLVVSSRSNVELTQGRRLAGPVLLQSLVSLHSLFLLWACSVRDVNFMLNLHAVVLHSSFDGT